MAEPKKLFLRNNENVKSALAIVNSDAFEVLMTFARAEFSLRNPTAEQGRGAAVFESVLRTLPIDEAEAIGWDNVTSGAHLHHELEIPINHGKPKPEEIK